MCRHEIDAFSMSVYIKCRCNVYKICLESATETKKDQIWIKLKQCLSTGVSDLFQRIFWLNILLFYKIFINHELISREDFASWKSRKGTCKKAS